MTPATMATFFVRTRTIGGDDLVAVIGFKLANRRCVTFASTHAEQLEVGKPIVLQITSARPLAVDGQQQRPARPKLHHCNSAANDHPRRARHIFPQTD